jgi:hypothetical protein
LEEFLVLYQWLVHEYAEMIVSVSQPFYYFAHERGARLGEVGQNIFEVVGREECE